MASQRRTTFAKNSNFQPFKMSVAFRPGRGAGNDQPSWFFPALIFVFRELGKRRWRCYFIAMASASIFGSAFRRGLQEAKRLPLTSPRSFVVLLMVASLSDSLIRLATTSLAGPRGGPRFAQIRERLCTSSERYFYFNTNQ
jgi:hypothetical protein